MLEECQKTIRNYFHANAEHLRNLKEYEILLSD